MEQFTVTKDTTVQGIPAWRLDSDERSLIASMTYATVEERDADVATAYLLEAAPALKEAVRLFLDAFDGNGVGPTVFAEKMTAAYAAAKTAMAQAENRRS